ncbi:MAG TPA: LamG-like jellyroll fold domain-containing protein, partial [Gemmataceae bacterium]|nr:LamG-like jellyroll fold domain-containing protein [Gemmataceae bacterium]
MNLGGAVTPPAAGITATGGTVNVTGTVTNTGRTLFVPAGAWNLNGGTIVGGVLDTAPGAVLNVNDSSTLNGVTIAGTVTVRTTGNGLTAVQRRTRVLNGLTLDGGTLNLVDGRLGFDLAQTIAGTGTITYSGGTNSLWVSTTATFGTTYVTGGTLNIEAGITVEPAADNAGLTVGGYIVGVAEDSQPFDTHLNNYGTLKANRPGSVLSIKSRQQGDGGSVFVNRGRIEASNGGTAWLNYAIWSNPNPGRIEMTNGTLELANTTTAAGLGTIVRSGGTVNLRATVNATGDVFELNDDRGTWNLAGGSINGGTFRIAPDSTSRLTLTALSSLQNGVTLDSPITYANSSVRLIANGGLTLNNVTMIVPGGLQFGTTGTLGGTGTVALTGGTLSHEVSNTELTIGPNITVRGRGTVGWEQGRVVNQGTILAEVPGEQLGVYLGRLQGVGGNSGTIRAQNNAGAVVNGGSGWINSGTIEAVGGTVQVNNGSAYNSAWTNTGSITAVGGVLSIAGLWSSTGTLAASYSLAQLGGTFPGSHINSLTRVAGTLNVAGTVTGGLTLNDAIGDINLRGATIQGGVVDRAPGSTARLIATTTQSLLSGVTLNAPIDMTTADNVRIAVAGGLTLNSTIEMGDAAGNTAASIQFNGSQTLDGTGTIVFGARSSAGTLQQQSAGDVLTIGPGLTLRGVSAGIGTVTGTLINKATIRRDAGAGTLTISFGPNGRNEGTIETTARSTAGGSRTVVTGGSNNTWTNAGAIKTDGVTLIGLQTTETWTNAGVIESTGGTLELHGRFTQAAMGDFRRDAASTVNFGTGARLTGGLTLDDTTGSWRLLGGEITGGTIRTFGSARLVGTGNYTTLRGVTLEGRIDLQAASASISIEEGLTLNTTLDIANNSVVYVRGGTQTFAGTGEIVFGAGTSNTLQGFGITPAVTLAEGLTVRGRTGSIINMGRLENRGTIAADVTGGAIDVGNTIFTNAGTVRAANGGEVRVHPTTLTNLTGTTTAGLTTTGTLTGGTWAVGPASTLRVYTNTTNGFRIDRLNADLTLDGLSSNFYGGAASSSWATYEALTALTAVDAGGRLTLRNNRSQLGVGTFTAAGDVTLETGARLNVVPTLVSRWAGATDATGRNPGTPNGTRVSIPDSPTLRAHQFTVRAVVNPTAFGNTPTILAKTANTSLPEGFGLRLSGTTGRPEFWINNGSTNTVTGTAALPLNTPSTLVASYDGVTMRLYVNGTQVATRAYDQPVTHSAAALVIGGIIGTDFSGSISTVDYYNRALSPAEADAQLAGPATYTQAGGTLTVAPTASLLSLNDGLDNDVLNLQAGTARGTGTVNADLFNAAVVAPGNSPGFLDIAGNYVQTATGVLELEIAGRDAALPQYDRVRVTGSASLDGTVRAVLLGDFEPAPGDEFLVLSSGGLSVAPTLKYELPAPGGVGRRLAPVANATSLTLQAQKVPPIELGTVTPADSAAKTYAHNVAVDAAGNAYAVGLFYPYQGTTDLDTTRTYADNRDLLTGVSLAAAAYVAKYDPTGALLWTRVLEANDPNYLAFLNAVAVDGRGNADPSDDHVYLVAELARDGRYNGGPTLVTSGGSAVLRIDPAGALVSSAVVDGASGYGIAVGPAGSVFVTGSFTGTVDFDPGAGTATQTATRAAFVLELTPGLGFLRVGQLGSTAAISGQAIAADAAGNVWVTGVYSAPTAGLAVLTTAGGYDAFVLKLAGSGTGFNTLVAQGLGGTGRDGAWELAVDPAGNVVLGGNFSGAVDFDAAVGRNFTLVSAGDTDAYVLKLAPDGAFVWARQFGGYREDGLDGVRTDAQGNVYSVGYFRDTVDFDPLDGTFPLAATVPIVPAADPTLGAGFLVKLDAAGRFVWATQPGGYGAAWSELHALDVAGNGRVYTVGAIAGPADFDPGTGTYIPPGIPTNGDGAGTLWVVAQKAAPTVTVAGLPAGAVLEGSPLPLAVQVTDPDSDYFTYAWTVTRDGTLVASGTGPALGLFPADQGTYQIAVRVTDESGNDTTETATVVVNNAPPTLHATGYGVGVAVPGATPAAGDQYGSALAAGGGYTLTGAPLTGTTDAGAAYLRTPGGVTFALVDPAPAAGGFFGAAVAVVGDYAVVSAPGAGAGSTS